MNAPKHTPCPWHTFRQGTKHYVSQAADQEFRFALAEVFETNYHPDGIAAARKEVEANARLIAAAPDLLHALRQIDSNAAESVEWIRRVAQAAIAKATEGAP